MMGYTPALAGIGRRTGLQGMDKTYDSVVRSTIRFAACAKISRWALLPDGHTIHARFDDTHGHIQEQDGHKVQ